MITGSGPIGTLCVLSCRRAGAEEIVVTDISDNALSFSNAVGADKIINTMKNYNELEQFQIGKGVV